MSTFSGKAHLLIERIGTDSDGNPEIDVHTTVRTCEDGRGECLQDEFGLLDYYCHWIPYNLHKLEIGERVGLAVRYEIVYTTDYWGESDMDIYLTKPKTMYRAKPQKMPYRTKGK